MWNVFKRFERFKCRWINGHSLILSMGKSRVAS